MSIEIGLYRNAGLGNRLDGAYPLGDGTSGVSEGLITANAFFQWDCESAPLGTLTTANSPFDNVDTYFAGAAEVSSGPAGAGARSGSKCIRMMYRNGIDEDGSFFYISPSSFPAISDIGTIYARWWEYYEGFSGDWPLALKVARFWSGPDGDASNLSYPYCSAKISNQFGMGSDGDQFCRGINHAIYNDDRSHAMEASDLFGNGLPYIREGRWYKHEMQLTLNSDYTGAGSADGIMRHWIDDVMFYEETDLVFGSANKGNGSYANGWNQMYFGGNYSGSTFGAPGKDLYRYIDDMYVSTTVDR